MGGLLYSIRSGAPSFKHYNSRGDVINATDITGTSTWQATYEAFGTRTQEVGSTEDRQKANTKEEDPTGLLNEGFRYRCLETGVFITRDPLGFVDGPNMYAYVVQNPWSKFDPLGLSPDEEEEPMVKFEMPKPRQPNDAPAAPTESPKAQDPGAQSARVNSQKNEGAINWAQDPVKLKEPITYSYNTYDAKTNTRGRVTKTAATEFSADDINYAARVVYAEASGGSSSGAEQDRLAVASVLLNRIGATGIPGGRKNTLTDVANAPGAFEAVFNRAPKFRNTAGVKTLDPVEARDLNASIAAVQSVIRNGPTVRFNAFRAAGSSPPANRTVIGGNAFFTESTVYRNSP